jgi:hypothetical protein
MGIDADGDGAVGVTAVGKNDATYTYTPTGLGVLGAAPTADKVYLVSRSAIRLIGKKTSCDDQTGTASVIYFDNPVIGCHVFNGGDCTRSGTGNQTDFVDGSRAAYASIGGTFVARRLADNASCADVRAALP